MSTTVIDALIITLGLDAKGFKQGQADANRSLDDTRRRTKTLTDDEKKRNTQQNQQHQNQKKQARETADNYKSMAREAAQFFGLIAGASAVKNWIVDLTQNNASLSRLSDNLQTSTETLSGWSGAVEQAGGSSKDAENTMRMLSMSMTEMMVNGNTAILPFMQQMGVSMVTAGNKAKPLEQILLDLAGAMEGKDRNTAFNLGKMMGIDEGTLNLLLKGRKAVEEMLIKQEDIGLVTQQNARESAELSRQWNEMTQKARGLGREIGGKLTPVLTDVLGRLMDFAKEHPNITGGALAGLLLWITPLGKIKWLLGGISTLLLADDWDKWQKGGESIIAKLSAPLKKFNDWWVGKSDREGISKGQGKEGVRKVTAEDYADTKAQQDETAKRESEAAKRDAEAAKRDAELRKNGGRDPNAKPLAQDKIIQHLMSKGMSRDNAISIAANIKAESGNRPFVSNGNAYGYGQHMPDRQRVFKDQFGKNYKESTPEEQLDFIVYELTEGMYKSVGNKLKNMSPSEGAKLLNDKYEVSASDPATLAKHANERARMAERLAGSSPNINNVPATTTNSNSTTYGQIVVYTQATDAQGIANALPRALANQSESGAF